MANHRPIGTCDICRQEKECTSVSFLPVKGEDSVKPKPYVGIVGTVFPGEFSMRCCEDCGRERGSVPKKAWRVAVLGHILMIAGIFLSMLLKGGRTGVYDPLMQLPIFAGWCMAMIAGCGLVMRNYHESGVGGLFLSIFAQFFPVFGLIVLAAKAKKLNRCARAVSALKPVAEEKRRSVREMDEALARRVESGAALTEAEQAQLEERKREKEKEAQREQYAREEQEQKTNTINMRHAVLSILFTIVIGLSGASVYSSGRGHMQLFRTIDLSPGGFAAVICVLIVWDVIALVSAMKKRK